MFNYSMTELMYYDLKNEKGVAPSLSVQVSREIGRRIVTGLIAEGALIDDETKLSIRFGVSKSVVREAVKMLVGKGLLDVKRGSGTRVQLRNNWSMLDDDVLAWHQSTSPSAEFLSQLMDIRHMMEPTAASWAAQFGTEESHQEIKKAHERMESGSRSPEDYVVADALFHRAIFKSANNEFLSALEGVIYSALLSSIKLTNVDPRDNASSIPLHREILTAILNRDGPAAEKKMKAHLDDTTTRLSKIIKGFNSRR